jgi:putative membrane protein
MTHHLRAAALAALALAALGRGAAAQSGAGRDISGYGWMHDGTGMGLGLLGGVTMLLFWAVLIAALVILLRWALGATGPWGGNAARAILDARFARGEIDAAEYESRKRALQG